MGNDNHDELGRFAEGPAGGGHSHSADKIKHATEHVAPMPRPVRSIPVVEQHRQALLKGSSGLANYAKEKGLSDAYVKSLIDENYSGYAARQKTYNEFLKAKK